MEKQLQPIVLLADSQLLFDGRLQQRLVQWGMNSRWRAVYVGVNNNNDPAFYQLFSAVMENWQLYHFSQVDERFSESQQQALKQADLILISGGDVEKGWQKMEQSGITDAIIERYYQGALLMGISAGAIQLGLFGRGNGNQPLTTLKLVPLVMDVHDATLHWEGLKELLNKVGSSYLTGIGIPKGGGAVYHPDHKIEALVQPLYEYRFDNERVVENLIFPQQEEEL